MTAQELEQEYREAELSRVTMDIRTLSDYVVDVVIPRERQDAAEQREYELDMSRSLHGL